MTKKDFKQVAKAEAIAWAKDWFRNLDSFVVLDLETTGLKRAQPVQIGIIDDLGDPVMNTLVKPTIPIEPGATRETGIGAEEVKDAPDFTEIYPALFEALDGKRVLIYNVSFDWPILERMCELHDLPIPDCPQVECAMLAFAKFYGQWSAWHRSFTFKKLDLACRELGVTVEGAHDATSDCLMTLRMVRAMAQSELKE